MSDIQNIIDDFTRRLSSVIEAQALAQARAAVIGALGGGVPVARRPGRPPKVARLPQVVAARTAAKKARKKSPRQLCPVPGCKNTAAPIFGMVCSDHQNVSKAKIKKFREARRAKKLGLKPAQATERRATKAARRKATAVAQAAAMTAATASA
jgi:hypothetical protein